MITQSLCGMRSRCSYTVLRISGCTLYSLANTNGTIPWGSATCTKRKDWKTELLVKLPAVNKIRLAQPLKRDVVTIVNNETNHNMIMACDHINTSYVTIATQQLMVLGLSVWSSG